MKPKLLLTLSSLFLVASLAGCAGEPGKTTLPTSEESSESEPSKADSSIPSIPSDPSIVSSEPSDPSEPAESEPSDVSSEPSEPSQPSVESSDPGETAFEAFFENLEGGNMTVTDAGWLTMSIYGDDAMFFEYNTTAYGYVLYEGERIFEFELGEESIVLTDEIIDEQFEGGSLLTYMANPFIFTQLDNVWTEVEDNVFTTDDSTVALITCLMGSYSAAASAYIDEVTLTVNEDGSEGQLACVIDAGTAQYNINLTIDGFGTTENELVDAYLADPWEYVAPEDPGTLDLLFENIAGRNFTFSGIANELVWETVYVMGDNALFLDYVDAENYGGVDNGLLSYEGNMYKYGIEDDVLVDLTFFEPVDPEYPSVLDYIYSPFDVLGADWEYLGDGVYGTDNSLALKAMATAVGYGSYSSYFDGVEVSIAEDGSEATFSIVNTYDMELFVTIGDFGDTALKAVTDYFADPYVPSAKTDWSEATKGIFEEAFGEVIPFYEGFTEKMVETNYLSSYGIYYITDAGLGAEDTYAYGEVLEAAGYVLDEEETEIKETGEIFLLYRKTRGDGMQILVQVEFEPVEVLSESVAASFPEGRFKILISLYQPPVELDSLETINALIAETEVFPELPEGAATSFHAIDSTDHEWYDLSLDVAITFESAEDLEAYQELYVAALEEKGFEYYEKYNDWEDEDNNYVEFAVDEDTNTLYITLVLYAAW